MSDWGSVGGASSLAISCPPSEYLSLLTTATLASPVYRATPTNGHADRRVSPGGSGKRLSFIEESLLAQFCADDDNVEDCIAFLNQEVVGIGMPSLYKDHSATIDLVQVVNCIYDLLRKHQRSARIREDLENRQHRAEVDLGHMELVQKRLKESLRQMERDSNQLLEKDRQLNNKHKLLDTKLKAEKDEVHRLQSVMHRRDVQYRHEMRKNEKQMSRLEERLRQLLSDKKDRKTGIELSNALQRIDGKRGLWKKRSRDEEEMYRLVISNYEEKQKELTVENSDLRRCLRDMQKELHALISRSPPDSPSKSPVNNSNLTAIGADQSEWSEMEDIQSPAPPDAAKPTEISDGHFLMPYEFVRDSIEKRLKEQCGQLKQYIRKMEKQRASRTGTPTHRPTPSKTDEKHDREMSRLSRQIERYRTIIEQQEALIQQSLLPLSPHAVARDDEDAAFLNDSQLWTEKKLLATAQSLFNEQKENFEEERKNFTEAAIRLGRQRKAFEEEKTSFLQQQFLELSPFKERDLLLAEAVRQVDSTKAKRRLPTTPSCMTESLTPRPHSMGRAASAGVARPYSSTPSTAELYRTLGLTKERRDRPRSSCSLRCGPVSMITGSSNGGGSELVGLKSSGSSVASRLPEHAKDNVQIALFSKQAQDDSD